GHKRRIHIGKERPPQVLAAFEEGFWRRLDWGPSSSGAGGGLLQGLSQRVWGPQDDSGPQFRQGVERPLSFPFRGTGLLKDRLTQTGSQVVMQYLHRVQQLDACFLGFRAGHTISSVHKVIWPYTPILYVSQYQRDNELT